MLQVGASLVHLCLHSWPRRGDVASTTPALQKHALPALLKCLCTMWELCIELQDAAEVCGLLADFVVV